MNALGLVESKSIAAGVELADKMLKAANVELVRASTICSGRYMIYVSGDQEAVASSVRIATESGRSLMGSFVISNLSPQVMSALKNRSKATQVDALGVIECRNVSSGVVAADCAVKRAAVDLLRLVTGQGINGKSYFVISGDVESVKEATEAAIAALGKNLIETVVIPRPSLSIINTFTAKF